VISADEGSERYLSFSGNCIFFRSAESMQEIYFIIEGKPCGEI